MTIKEAKRLYIGAGGPSDHTDSEWEEIRDEMQAVINATSDRAASKIIDWWACWSRGHPATKFAKKVRLLAKEKK